jgi:Ca2+-transporting ATPase
VTNGLPALALGVDPAEPGQMKRPPRPPTQGIVGWRDLAGVILVGAIMSAAALSFYAMPSHWPELFTGDTDAARLSEARTMAFVLLGLSPLFHAFNCRSPTESIFTVGWFSNGFLWLSIGISAVLQFGSVLVPAARGMFGTTVLSPVQWAVVIGLSLAPVPIVEVFKVVDRFRVARRPLVSPRGD